MAADDHLGEAWRREWAGWLALHLPASLVAAGCGVREATQEGDRALCEVVVGYRRVERVPSMPGTGRVHGVVVLREPYDGETVAEHRSRVADLWEVLATVTGRPGPFDDVYLHDVRWEDRESEVDDNDRVTAWPLSTMATRV